MSVPAPTWRELNLPERFRELVADRALIDIYQSANHLVREGPPLTVVSPRLVRNRVTNAVEVVPDSGQKSNREFRSHNSEKFLPLRGFRAPILEKAGSWRPLMEQTRKSGPDEQRAARWINDHLAQDGLLPTLVRVVGILGADSFATNRNSTLLRLNSVGFPEDLLACFSGQPEADPEAASLEVVEMVARRLQEGVTPEELIKELGTVPFFMPDAWCHFSVLSEAGEHPLGMLRMQVGGGYANGVIPGESIDVIRQLVLAVPELDFIVVGPEELTVPFSQWAGNALPLNRPAQLKVIAFPGAIEAWSQDNGKAGVSLNPDTGLPEWTTLTPRYASREEGISMYLPTESYAMDALQSSGHRVIHFPLLFQGGNVLPTTDPATGRRYLLVGEGVVHRNTALGLSSRQVFSAFRDGFNVDECIMVPGVSYHLDFDVNVRTVDGEMVAFVNDPMAAARMILGLALDTFEKNGLVEPQLADVLRYDLEVGTGKRAHQVLSDLVRSDRMEGRFTSAKLASMFKATGYDSAEGNTLVFLQALDWLAANVLGAETATRDLEYLEYLNALRRMDIARLAQVAVLQSRGWKIVPVPSMPDLGTTINYVNGIHHSGGYLMPAYRGFYSPLDEAAESVIAEKIGKDLRIVRIQCAELQRKHGAVHCAVSAYPAIP